MTWSDECTYYIGNLTYNIAVQTINH